MSDSDEDYMSDKILNACTEGNSSGPPSLLFSNKQKRELELYKKKQQQKVNRPKSQWEYEEELREKGLNTAISSDNKGFKMLEKMGFKTGEGLGKFKTGVKEPIPIKVKTDSSGVGKRTTKEIINRKRKYQETDLNQKADEFQATTKEKIQNRLLSKEFYKVQKVCEELDFRNGIEDPNEDYFWTKDTIKKKLEISEEDEEEFTEHFATFISEENLCKIIDYLRTKYLYCFYCAFVANDENDLNSSCPGPYKEDHSSILDI